MLATLLGVVTLIGSLGFSVWASYQLGSSKSISVLPELPPEATLMTDGAYECVRRPRPRGCLPLRATAYCCTFIVNTFSALKDTGGH